jgi:hypothetical protein
MARPIKIKINVTRILKEYIFEGKNGKYLNLVAWPNKNGTGQYGDTHFVSQDIPKEARDEGVQAPILGNLTLPEDEAPARQQQRPAPRPNAPRRSPPGTIEYPETPIADGMADDEIPF